MIAKKTNTESTKQVSHKNKVLRNKYRFILNTLDFLFWGEGGKGGNKQVSEI